MARHLFPLFLIILSLSCRAQKEAGIEKSLNIYWKSKNVRALLVARECQFQAGDTVADIGAGDGWFTAALAAHTDDVVFYLEDIDSAGWNRARFDSAVVYFSAQRQNKASNQFHFVRGHEQSSRLPTNTFDKVLIIDTYHHFDYLPEMISDAVSLLKEGGTLVILEALARKPGDIHQGCRRPIFSENEIISEVTRHGMTLKSVMFIHKVARRKNKLFIFARV